VNGSEGRAKHLGGSAGNAIVSAAALSAKTPTFSCRIREYYW
jgi:hypothetical protein